MCAFVCRYIRLVSRKSCSGHSPFTIHTGHHHSMHDGLAHSALISGMNIWMTSHTMDVAVIVVSFQLVCHTMNERIKTLHQKRCFPFKPTVHSRKMNVMNQFRLHLWRVSEVCEIISFFSGCDALSILLSTLSVKFNDDQFALLKGQMAQWMACICMKMVPFNGIGDGKFECLFLWSNGGRSLFLIVSISFSHWPNEYVYL